MGLWRIVTLEAELHLILLHLLAMIGILGEFFELGTTIFGYV